jgi:hypothetical protein
MASRIANESSEAKIRLIAIAREIRDLRSTELLIGGVKDSDRRVWQAVLKALPIRPLLTHILHHERTHVFRFRTFGAPEDTATAIEFEKAARRNNLKNLLRPAGGTSYATRR